MRVSLSIGANAAVIFLLVSGAMLFGSAGGAATSTQPAKAAAHKAKKPAHANKAIQAAQSASAKQKGAAFDYDPGLDYGLANINTVLFAVPSISGVELGPVKAGEVLFLVPTHAIPDWTNVVQLTTGWVGWVKSVRLDIFHSDVKETPLYFTTHRDPDNNSPTVAVQNGSSSDVRLRLDDQSFIISAKSTKTIPLAPGRYSYIVSAPNRIPQFGTRTFETDFIYSWSLFEDTGPVLAPNPPSHN